MLAWPRSVRADYEVPNPSWNPPTHYYDSANSTGFALRTNLHNIITAGFRAVNYGDARYAMGTGDTGIAGGFEDIDPNNSANILLVYNRASVDGQWDSGVTWNREHVWPKSLLNLTSSQVSATYKGVASDAFELRPSDPNVNSSRLNFGYGFYPNTGSNGTQEYGTNSGDGNTYWYPGNADRGEVARAIFYMATRWFDPTNPSRGTSNTNLELVNGPPSLYNFGDLNSLLHWNYLSGVDNFERRRNQYIYGALGDNVPTSISNINPYYQANRNPYIDHPEYVWAVFGGFSNDSQLYVGASPGASGGTSTTVNLRVMKNGTWSTTSTNLRRAGNAPTTYNLTASGSASTTAAGSAQGYDSSLTAKSIPITLTGSTATTGPRNGSIAIHNTDLTSSGAGHGSSDGDDTINVTGQVVDNRVITASSVDFGRVIAGASLSMPTTLNSPGGDDTNTRLTVRGIVGATDANGVVITAGIDNVFNGTLTIAGRNLQGNFATAGNKSGSRSFTLQGEGLTGESVQPVSVGYTATVLDHSNGSFATPADSDGQTIDFGYVPAGFAPRTAPFTVYNLASANGAVLTAALHVDDVTGSTAQMSTDVVAGTQIAAGDSLARTATFTPAASDSDNSATHTIAVSDENIPGATAGTSLVLTTNGRTVTTGTFPVTGFINLLDGETYGASAFAIQSGVTLTKTGPGAINVTGTQSHGSGAALLVNQGNVTMSSDAANLAVAVSGATSSVNFNSTQHLASLSVSGHATASLGADGSRVLVTDSLDTTFAGGGKIDLSDNKMIVRNGSVGSFSETSYTGIAGAIQSGRNGGAWDGNGIITSQSTAATGSLTTLGVAIAAEVKGLAGIDTATWAGETVSAADVLVMYTYGGDANLDGKINVDDYGRIDSSIPLGIGGWFNGDFNYDGKVNVDDYGIIDSNIGIQGAPFSTGGGTSVPLSSSGVSAVPEPACVMLVVAPLGGLLRRRRR